MKRVGLVGGISWVSTMDYYKLINENINSKLSGLNFAECVIYSLNFGGIQAVGWNHAFEHLLKACESLQKSGVDAMALCANTAHLHRERLQKEIPLPFIDIIDETVKVITHNGFKKAGLLGTKFTMEMSFYRNQFEQSGIEVIIPDKEETRDYIQFTLKNELGKGIINPDTREKYIAIAKELINRGAECLILGCTEIPMLIGQEDFSISLFDTTQIHSEAIANFALS